MQASHAQRYGLPRSHRVVAPVVLGARDFEQRLGGVAVRRGHDMAGIGAIVQTHAQALICADEQLLFHRAQTQEAGLQFISGGCDFNVLRP